jgi:hypothetical protein
MLIKRKLPGDCSLSSVSSLQVLHKYDHTNARVGLNRWLAGSDDKKEDGIRARGVLERNRFVERFLG